MCANAIALHSVEVPALKWKRFYNLYSFFSQQVNDYVLQDKGITAQDAYYYHMQ